MNKTIIVDNFLEELYDEAYDLYMEWNEWVEEANPTLLVLAKYEKK